MDNWVNAWMSRRKERGGGGMEEGRGKEVDRWGGGHPGDTSAGSAFQDFNDVTQDLRLPGSHVQPSLAPQIPGLWIPTPAPR